MPLPHRPKNHCHLSDASVKITLNLPIKGQPTMILFLRNIPANTGTTEIINYLQPAVRAGLFAKSGEILVVKVMSMLDQETGEIEHHGLAVLDSDETGRRVIKKLNGKPFKGKRMVVREYMLRRWQNDPRRKQVILPPDIVDQRQSDRRRNKVRLKKVVDISTRLSSLEGFAPSL